MDRKKLAVAEAAAMRERAGPCDRCKVERISAFMAEQTEREAAVDWLRRTGDSMNPGTEWRAYYAAADAIETEQHRALPATGEVGRG